MQNTTIDEILASSSYNNAPKLLPQRAASLVVKDAEFESLIEQTPELLTRSYKDLVGARDEKLGPVLADAEPEKVVIYYNANPELKQMVSEDGLSHILSSEVGEDWAQHFELKALPDDFLNNPEAVKDLEPPGFLHLGGSEPPRWVVPGGRFQEAYGWDSNFAANGYIKEQPEFARQVADNQLFQIEHYGAVLNGAKSYYLTRSHPPMISDTVMKIVKQAEESGIEQFGFADDDEFKRWQQDAYETLEKYWEYWQQPDKTLDTETRLSRYYDAGDWEAPEVAKGEPMHYPDAKRYFKELIDKIQEGETLLAQEYHLLDRCCEKTNEAETRRDLHIESGNGAGLKASEIKPTDIKRDENGDVILTPSYHMRDRTMRATGHDPSGRFGYGNLLALDYAPVELNSLLYNMEGNMAALAERTYKNGEVEKWQGRASERKAAMDKHMWNEKAGIYQDAKFHNRHDRDVLPEGNELPQKNVYAFATDLWPLWTDLLDPENKADVEKAKTIVEHVINAGLITQHGLMTSAAETGSQWDAPNGWAPMQVAAVKGLMRFGDTFKDEALQIARGFNHVVRDVFYQDGSIHEKYNLRDGNAEIKVTNGYGDNASEDITYTVGKGKDAEEKQGGVFLWSAAGVKALAECERALQPELHERGR